MSILIHIMEALATILFVAMVAQIRRAYTSYVSLHEAQKTSLQSHLDMQADVAVIDEIIQLESQDEKFEAESSEFSEYNRIGSATHADKRSVLGAQKRASAGVSEAGASQILDDYIGGFFNEPAAPEIREFKTVSVTDANKIVSTKAVNEDASQATLDIRSYKAATRDQEDIPVLQARIPEELLTERFVTQRDELDGEVIVVEDRQEPGVHGKNVMSDKVVLAMLGEAKLVSVN
jgi:hypothetical protein